MSPGKPHTEEHQNEYEQAKTMIDSFSWDHHIPTA
jgi:hypothetical protein